MIEKTMLEIEPVCLCNFDQFAVDFSGDHLSLNGRTYSLGQVTTDILNLPVDFLRTRLHDALTLSKAMVSALKEEYDAEKFRLLRQQILIVIDSAASLQPISYFDVEYSRAIVESVLSEKALEDYGRAIELTNNLNVLPDEEWLSDIQKALGMVKSLSEVYIYLCSDVFNFHHLVRVFIENLVVNNVRTQKDLAALAAVFFTDEDNMKGFFQANPLPFLESVTLRPRATIVPVAAMEGEAFSIKRRIYFGRLMDFFVTDFFEALMVGHYPWKCQYCGRYFLMTSARNQRYCHTVHPAFGVPCSNLAKHRKTRTEETKKNPQSVTDNPYHVMYTRRRDAIRKAKSRNRNTEAAYQKVVTFLKECYDRAMMDPEYAASQYALDLKRATLRRERSKEGAR